MVSFLFLLIFSLIFSSLSMIDLSNWINVFSLFLFFFLLSYMKLRMFQVKENQDHYSKRRYSQKNNGQMCYKRDEYVQES